MTDLCYLHGFRVMDPTAHILPIDFIKRPMFYNLEELVNIATKAGHVNT